MPEYSKRLMATAALLLGLGCSAPPPERVEVEYDQDDGLRTWGDICHDRVDCYPYWSTDGADEIGVLAFVTAHRDWEFEEMFEIATKDGAALLRYYPRAGMPAGWFEFAVSDEWVQGVIALIASRAGSGAHVDAREWHGDSCGLWCPQLDGLVFGHSGPRQFWKFGTSGKEPICDRLAMCRDLYSRLHQAIDEQPGRFQLREDLEIQGLQVVYADTERYLCQAWANGDDIRLGSVDREQVQVEFITWDDLPPNPFFGWHSIDGESVEAVAASAMDARISLQSAGRSRFPLGELSERAEEELHELHEEGYRLVCPVQDRDTALLVKLEFLAETDIGYEAMVVEESWIELELDSGHSRDLGFEKHPFFQRRRRELQPVVDFDGTVWATWSPANGRGFDWMPGEMEKTVVGQFDLDLMDMEPITEIDGLRLGSDEIWVDEAAGRIYLLTDGVLLRLPLDTEAGI